MKIPKLCHEKSQDRAYVYDGRRKVYLGKWGEPSTVQKYADYIDSFVNGFDTVMGVGVDRRVVTIADLVAKFVSDHERYYVNADGLQTGQLARIQTALEVPLRLFADLPVDEFGALKLQVVRSEMVKSNRFTRTYLNTLINCIRHVFKYGVEQELVKPETLLSLKAVSPLKRGRTTAREGTPVLPVSADVVNATIAAMAPTLAAMVQLQRFTGMRPGEVCIMKAKDVETDGEPWTYTLSHDKTDYRRAVGDLRSIPLGKRAQCVLSPFLEHKEGDEYLFSPFDAQQERAAEKRIARTTPITAQTIRRDNRPSSERKRYNPRYTVDAYRRAIWYACKQAGVAQWSPNQLRHLYATEVRAKYGLEAAQIMLGHSTADVTQIYAERDKEKAIQIAKEIG